MRPTLLVTTFFVALAVSASAQVLTPMTSGSGSASELLSRAARMAAENQQKFNRRPAQPVGWMHGSPTANSRPTNWR